MVREELRPRPSLLSIRMDLGPFFSIRIDLGPPLILEGKNVTFTQANVAVLGGSTKTVPRSMRIRDLRAETYANAAGTKVRFGF